MFLFLFISYIWKNIPFISMVYINECIDVNTALKISFKNLWVVCIGSISFQEISFAGKPQVVSRFILTSYASNAEQLLFMTLLTILVWRCQQNNKSCQSLFVIYFVNLFSSFVLLNFSPTSNYPPLGSIQQTWLLWPVL